MADFEIYIVPTTILFTEKYSLMLQVTGQGAGIAAAVSLSKGKSTHDVDIKDVQEELKKQGVRYQQ